MIGLSRLFIIYIYIFFLRIFFFYYYSMWSICLGFASYERKKHKQSCPEIVWLGWFCSPVCFQVLNYEKPQPVGMLNFSQTVFAFRARTLQWVCDVNVLANWWRNGGREEGLAELHFDGVAPFAESVIFGHCPLVAKRNEVTVHLTVVSVLHSC